jgi:hypothetical protein
MDTSDRATDRITIGPETARSMSRQTTRPSNAENNDLIVVRLGIAEQWPARFK